VQGHARPPTPRPGGNFWLKKNPPVPNGAVNKSLFASFSSEKEDSCSFLKKRTKRLLSIAASTVVRA
jgi:hypothetical protein